MSDQFEIIDATTLPASHRELLRPDEAARIPGGASVRLPRFFYRIESWAQARETKLTSHFTLSELMAVDCREARPLLQRFPHYVPCTVSLLARYLETFRERCEAPVFIAVNGGYRSPAHAFSAETSLHPWCTAADVYRVGDAWLDDEKTIDRYAKIAGSIGQEVSVAPYGHGEGKADDHLHVEIGLIHWAPVMLPIRG
jgi:hypothetical protein